jgi:hypothetical protein
MPVLVNARFLVTVLCALPLSRFRPTGPAPLRPRLRLSHHLIEDAVRVSGRVGRPP